MLDDGTKNEQNDIATALQAHLNLIEHRFADAVLGGKHAGEAYQLAVGKPLAPGSAKRMAQKLLKRPLISAYLMARKLALMAEADRLGATSERVTEEIASLAFSRLDDYEVDWETGRIKPAEGKPDHVMRAVGRVKFTRQEIPRGKDLPPIVHTTAEIWLWNKPQALRMLGEIHGMFIGRRDSVGSPEQGPDLV